MSRILAFADVRRRPGQSVPSSVSRGLLCIAVALVLPVVLIAQTTTRVSVGSGGVEVSGGRPGYASGAPSLSADGRYVSYYAADDDLVLGDTNNAHDIFVHDRLTGQTTRVSMATGGGQGNGPSFYSAISADGRYVAFDSYATNLVPGDTTNTSDIFVHDRQTGHTTRVSVATDGGEANSSSYFPAISADGRYVAFSSSASNLVPGDTNNAPDIFVHDRQTGQTTRVNVATDGGEANGFSFDLAISADGRYVAFASSANNLVPGDTNEWTDIFAYDRLTGQTTRVSVTTGGGEPNGSSSAPAISGDGRYVAFTSWASNLVPGDTNGQHDIFVCDVWTGQTTRVSVAPGGGEANGPGSDEPAISADGQHVAFTSAASNLVPNDTNGVSDVFVHDRSTGQTARMSVGLFGQQGNRASHTPASSADGNLVVFDSAATNLVPGDTNGLVEPFVRDRATGTLSRAMVRSDGAQAIGGSGNSSAAISADGRYVAFSSPATSLTTRTTTQFGRDVFVHDRVTGGTSWVTEPEAFSSYSDSWAAAISLDGRYVVVASFELLKYSPFPDTLLSDQLTGQITTIATGGGPWGGALDYGAAVSMDGRHVAFVSGASDLVPGEINHALNVFVHDRLTGQTTRVSVSTGGGEANSSSGRPAMSADGRCVAFQSYASNLVPGDANNWSDIFVRDRLTGQTTRVSVATGGIEANSSSGKPSISADGRYVAFYSDASNLVPGDTNGRPDVFVHDRQTGQTTRVGVDTRGWGYGSGPAISADGRYVAFESGASNLVPGKTNYGLNVFVHDRLTGETRRVSVATGGGEGNGGSTDAAISADGQHVAFTSDASNLVPNDTNGASDVFVASADTDQDGLPYDWEVQFGLDPTDATGVNGPLGDPDGDGRTNAQELAEQTHPTNVAALSRYLAEGATSRFFDTQLALFNPTATPARALVRYLNADGTVTARYRYVPGYTRVTLNPKDVLHLPVAEFSTQLETDGLLVLDRTMRWDTTTFYGSHAETAMLAPAPQWYFAEGATHSGFSLFYLLQNPHATDTTVTLTYLRPGGLPPLEKPYTVAANSRRTIWVNHEAATDPALADLAATDLSVVVTADDPALPVVAERAMYLDTDGLVFGAGHESAGVTAPALNWFLAEGATGDYFDLFVLLANPNPTAAEVLVTYLLPSGATVVKPHTVPANARVTLWVDHEDAALADTAVSTTVAVTNGVPILAERAMWWPGPTWATWAEAHNSPGSPVTGPTWALAEGEVSQDWHIVTYLLIANTSPTVGEARVTLYLEDGTTRTRTFALAANSRFNVDVAGEFPDVVNQRFGAIVESLGPTPAELVVERAMYSDAPGLVWAAGTNALGTRLP